ncbi:MAG: hypothetical protein ACR2MF_04070 [Chthoniobacterales bacterium]
MSYDLDSYDTRTDIGGFSFSRAVRAGKKVVKPAQKIFRKAAPSISLLPLPGAGVLSRVVSRAAPPKPPPKRKRKSNIIPINRAGSPKASGVFSDVTSGSSTLPAQRKRLLSAIALAKKKMIKTQADVAGIRFKKRAKKNGTGTETVAVNSDGAVVSKPIPDSVLRQADVTVDSSDVLSADAVQANAPAIPSAKSVEKQAVNTADAGAGGSGGSGVAAGAPLDAINPAPDSVPDSGLLSNPFLLAGVVGIAFLVMSRR